ncbi:hypothetical protein Gpo141_00010004 [Globisporangium polare]
MQLRERRLLAAELLTTSAAAAVDNQQQQEPGTQEQQPEEGAATKTAADQPATDATTVTTNNNTAGNTQDATADVNTNNNNVAVVRGDGCATDLERFCSRDASILTLLENAPTGIDASQVTRAMKNVQLCMAKNVESLSPVCIEALVASLVNQKSSDVHTAAAADVVQPTTYQSVPDSNQNNNNLYNGNAPDDNEDSSVEVSIHYSKHHNTAGAGLRGAHPALTAAAPAIEQAKQAASGDMDIASPLMWFLVFPFFCIGLYVTYNHALVYVRRRRESLRIESKQYMPVP